MSRDDGGPAFPPNAGWRDDDVNCRGMSLRDYFAAQAFAAVYTNAMKEASEGSGLFQHDDWPVGLAMDAYRIADAMLKARAK